MDALYVPIGLAIGVVVAAPVGPVNVICLNRAFSHGGWSAFFIGIGAALGDGLFAALAAFGLAYFTQMVDANRDVIRFIGGLIMLAFAYGVWRARPHLDDSTQIAMPAWRQAIAVFVMTITNPATLMGFTAIFAGTGFKMLGTQSAEHVTNSVMLVAGVIGGSLLWWAGLSYGANHFKSRISDRTLVKINHASAILLALFGVGAMIAGIVD